MAWNINFQAVCSGRAHCRPERILRVESLAVGLRSHPADNLTDDLVDRAGDATCLWWRDATNESHLDPDIGRLSVHDTRLRLQLIADLEKEVTSLALPVRKE